MTHAEETAERVAENVWLKLIGRAAMLAVIPVLGYVGSVAASISAKIDHQGNDLDALKSRVVVLETTTSRGREDRIEFQRATTQTLRELQIAINQQNGQISALIATIEAQQRQLDKGR